MEGTHMTTVHIAKVDGDVLSVHETTAGAGRAIADEVSRRYAAHKGQALSAEDTRAIAVAVSAKGSLVLELGRGLAGQVDGIGEERLTNIAFQINRRFDVVAKELLT